jgi:hypothetical protein
LIDDRTPSNAVRSKCRDDSERSFEGMVGLQSKEVTARVVVEESRQRMTTDKEVGSLIAASFHGQRKVGDEAESRCERVVDGVG